MSRDREFENGGKMKTAEVLRKALELFGPNGERWVSHPPGFGEYCATSAIDEVSHDGPNWLLNSDPARDAIRSALCLDRFSLLSDWNDSHTWPEVKAAFEQAIKNCEAEAL